MPSSSGWLDKGDVTSKLSSAQHLHIRGVTQDSIHEGATDELARKFADTGSDFFEEFRFCNGVQTNQLMSSKILPFGAMCQAPTNNLKRESWA